MTHVTPLTPPEPVDLTRLAAVVRAFRGTRPLSQAARELGMAPSTLLRIETGQVTPDLKSAMRLARWTGMSLDELVYDQAPAAAPISLADHVAYLLHRDGALDRELIEALRKVIALIVERTAQRRAEGA